LLHVDPRGLVVGVNTRTDAALDKAFLASIAARGVREPIIVRRGEGGVLVVRKGQRRALAAVQAGLELVAVVVEPEPLADQPARDIDRIIDQLGENQHRAGLPVTDEVAAHQQLLDLGLTAGQIARATHTRPARVKTTLAVGRSGLAAAAMARHDLSLEQAAVIADFDGDQAAVTALVAAAKIGPGQFEHVAQRARDDRTETRLRTELTARLHTAGVTTIDRPEVGRGRSTVLGLNQLRPGPHTEPGTVIGEADHAECPGHVAWLENSWRSDQPVAVAYGCRDWVGNGHAEQHAPAGQTTTTPPAGTPGGPMSEQQKAERRTVIANNKAWVSATTVRQAWLRQFLTRKSPPKDAQQWIAATLADGSHDLRRAMEDQHSLARDLLGLAETDDQRWYRGCRPHPLAAAAHAATTARATILTLAMLLAALEDGTSNDTWRRPSPESAAYLATLAGWGYELSQVEQLLHAEPAHTTTPGGTAEHTTTPATRSTADTGSAPDTGSTADTADGDVRGGHAA
jgi:ParB family chromosome partitioning protein